MSWKCIRLVGQGIPARLSETDARTIVEVDHDGEYCTKSVWKRFHDANADERFRERAFSRIDPRGRIVSA